MRTCGLGDRIDTISMKLSILLSSTGCVVWVEVSISFYMENSINATVQQGRTPTNRTFLMQIAILCRVVGEVWWLKMTQLMLQ